MGRLEEKKANRESLRAKQVKQVRMATILCIVLIAAVLLGINFYRQAKAGVQLDAQIKDLERQISEQEKEKEHYDSMAELYKTEEYQKLFAKERLGLVEENEKVFVDVSGE